MLISIIIPTLNEAENVPNLLYSLSCQLDKSFEVIIVDGASEDKTIAKINKFKPIIPRLKIIVMPFANLSAQRNKGACCSKGDYLIFTDADTVLKPEFIPKVSRFLRSKKPDFTTTLALPDQNHIQDKLLITLINIGTLLSNLSNRPVALGPMTIVARKPFLQVKGFNDHYHYAEDVEFSWKMSDAGYKMDILNERLYYLSLRRYRKYGYIRTYFGYTHDMFRSLLTGKIKNYKNGYSMGGHNYK